MVFGKEYGLAYCSQSPYRISFSAHHPLHKYSPSSPTITNTWPFFTTLLTRLSRSNNTKTFSNSSNTMPSIPTSNGIFDETTTRKASHPLQTAKNASFSQQHSQLNPPPSRDLLLRKLCCCQFMFNGCCAYPIIPGRMMGCGFPLPLIAML